MKLTAGTYLNKGRYRIEKFLGQGSFGITYLAVVNIVGTLGYIPSSTRVAIKEFFMRDINGRNEDTVTTGSKEGIFYNYKRRFIKEAKTLSKLHHPNIVHVLDLFEENNTAYYVMEYIDGGSLDKLISDKQKLSMTESRFLITKIARALEYMHSKRILHLDLKPANVMLTKSGEPILIDFGLTKEFDDNGEPKSSTTVGHGTPGYAPIEQANYQSGQGFQPTLDIYALGATFYKMLSGKKPPIASDILNEGIDILQLYGLDERAITVIRKSLSPMRNQRYQNVGELLRSIGNNKSTDPSTFPSNTISILIAMKNDVYIYYFRGKVYKDISGAFTYSRSSVPSLSSLKEAFFESFIEEGDLTLTAFVSRYWDHIVKSDIILASFLAIEDYFRLLSVFDDSYLKYKPIRIIRENSAVADFLSSYQEGLDGARDVVYSLHYDNTDIGFLCSDDVIEIRTDFEQLRSYSQSYAMGKRFCIKDAVNLNVPLFGGLLKTHHRLTGIEKCSLLLDLIPFDIYFGPKWGSLIPKLVDLGTTIPTWRSESFDFIGTDHVGIKFTDRMFLIDVASDFGYAPKEIECAVECGVSLQDITFNMRDSRNNKEYNYKLKELLNKPNHE